MNPQPRFLRPLFQKLPSYLPVNEPMTPRQDFFGGGGLRRRVLLYSSCAQPRYTSWAQICSAFVFVFLRVLLYSSCAQLRYTSWAQICSAFVFVFLRVLLYSSCAQLRYTLSSNLFCPFFLSLKKRVFCCIQVVLNSDTQVELKSVLPFFSFLFLKRVLLYSSCAQLRYTSWAQICSAFGLKKKIYQHLKVWH